MIRIGILGAARIAPGAIIAPAARRDDCVITAIACRSVERGQSFADRYGIASVLSDYDHLIARDDIDLIYNALPPSHHAALTIKALQSGKAVLCEKPFAMNGAEARAMVESANHADQPLIEAFHYRFHPAFQFALRSIRDGMIGDIVSIDAYFTIEIPYTDGEFRHIQELGGGALMDIGCYPVHWARTLAGTEPQLINAKAQTNIAGDIDVEMTASVSFSNDINATLMWSMKPGIDYGAQFTVVGTKGRLEFKNPLAPSCDAIIIETDGQAQRHVIKGMTTYDHQLDHVLSVMKGSDAPLTGGQDSIATMTFIDNLYRAAGMSPRAPV